MNSKVHPLVATLVIVLTIAVIGVWMWATGRAKEMGGPSQLLVDSEGHLYVQMQNFLLEHDQDGRFVKRHELAALGVERVLGEIAFFPDGDVLLRRGADERTVLDNIRAYLRLDNRESITASSRESGLSRCNLDDGRCVAFGDRVDFKATYSVAIEDDVYISDTTRHQLRKYSSTGEPLAVARDGYRFPNQLVKYDDRLHVVNTNYHEIRIVDPATDTFGREISRVNVVPAIAARNKHNWPSHIARVGSDWWINSMQSNMADGGVYLFDEDWVFKSRVDLPAGADPISIVPFNGEVLVSDWNNDRVHRVLVNGVRIGDFVSTGLEELVEESVAQRRHYQAIAYTAVFAMGLVIVGLLVKGLLTPAEEDTEAGSRADSMPPVLSDELVWFTPDPAVVRKLKLSSWISGIAVVAMIPLALIVIVESGLQLARISFVLPLAAIGLIFVPILWASRSNIETAIGLRGGEVLLRDHTGKETALPVGRIRYTDTAIAAPDTAIFLGQHQMAIYDRDQLKSQVFPRLAEATRVSAWEMQKILFRVRHPQAVATLFVIAGALLGGVALALAKLAG